MFLNKLSDYSLILASQSPRRSYLLREAGIDFTLADPIDVDEVFPKDLPPDEITIYLAELKADAYSEYIKNKHTILITADTIVWQNNKVIGKPLDLEDARIKLSNLSGNIHEVYTGVSLRSLDKSRSFAVCSRVIFNTLEDDEIDFYLKKYKPIDKAGAYGIQEWIGYIGIKSIEGSFFNVMGLPVHQLYVELKRFINE